MKGRYEPDCACSPPKSAPEFTEYQVGKLPIEVGLNIRCAHCKKPWKETLVEWFQPIPDPEPPKEDGRG